MKSSYRIFFLCILSFFMQLSGISQNQQLMVFTAYQGFNSRLYVMDAGGNVEHYHEYVNYRLQDMTVINNEVYVTDAFIPCIYKVDVITGELELIVHDLWLFYFYGLAWDGAYFYVDEWDLNRYNILGEKDGTADFDDEVMGATFANGFYWMLNYESEIKCWDFSGWPDLIEIPDQGFSPPSPDCRGLWFDGEKLWTAESVEGALGSIYSFDFEGQVLGQWTAPAFKGWAACRVDTPLEIRKKKHPSFQVEIFPNPADDLLNIAFNLEESGKINVQLFDVSGYLVEEFLCTFPSSGKQTFNWLINASIQPGNYIMRIVKGKNEIRQQIVIQ